MAIKIRLKEDTTKSSLNREEGIQRIRERKQSSDNQLTYIVLSEKYSLLQEKYNVVLEHVKSLKEEIAAYKVANSRLTIKLENTKKVLNVLVEEYLPELGKIVSKPENREGIVIRSKDNVETKLDKELHEGKAKTIYENYVRKFSRLNRLSERKKRSLKENKDVNNKLIETNEKKETQVTKGAEIVNLSPYIQNLQALASAQNTNKQ